MPIVNQGYELWAVPVHAFDRDKVHAPARVIAWDINRAADVREPVFAPGACNCPSTGRNEHLLAYRNAFFADLFHADNAYRTLPGTVAA